METELTKVIKKELLMRSQRTKGCYGAFEVTPMNTAYGAGYERCDYVEFNTKSEITCYEIKISVDDFKSKNKQTYLGDKNYLVIPDTMLMDVLNTHLLHSGIGIMTFDKTNLSFNVAKKCSKKTVGISERVAFLEGIARASCRDMRKLMLKD